MVGVVGTRTRAGIVAVAALPLLLGAGAGAAPATARGGPVVGTYRVVPLGALVPGLPLPAGARDTPDEALAPNMPHGPLPGRSRAAVPTPEQAGAAALTEFVPADDAAAGARSAAFCSRHTGPYQRQVEDFLRSADRGRAALAARQTDGTCAAIRGYQRAHGIRPAIGFAGPVTWGVMGEQLLAGAGTPARLDAAHRCPAGDHRVACVDQDRQLMWVSDGGRIVFGPVRVRTGTPGMPTRGGAHRVYWRHASHTSVVYGTPMPYSQFFDGGEAFHGIYGSLYAPTGSFGSVNLRVVDARRLWRVLRRGDRVVVWGRKPG